MLQSPEGSAPGGAQQAPAAEPWIAGLDAIGEFILRVGWPALAAFVIWRFFPAIRAIIESRAFTLEVAGVKVSVESATLQLSDQIADLQQQVIKLREAVPAGVVPPVAVPTGPAPAAPPAAPATSPSPAPSPAPSAPPAAPPVRRPRPTPPSLGLTPRVLWVDDKPSNNAFQIAKLEREGVRVVKSLDTADAMAALRKEGPFHAVISDMGRREPGGYAGQAGLMLLQQMREEGYATPFMLYTSEAAAGRDKARVVAAGGQGATASPVELLEWLRAQFASSGGPGGRPAAVP